jgi:hypothetical protein
MNWQKLTPDNLPQQDSWVLVTDGVDWEKTYVTNQFEFVPYPDSKKAYKGATHWCEVELP